MGGKRGGGRGGGKGYIGEGCKAVMREPKVMSGKTGKGKGRGKRVAFS